LYSLPAPDCQRRQKTASGGEQHAEGVPPSRDSERRNEVDEGNATGDQRERGADPGEEGPLVGEREAVVRLPLVAGRLGLSFRIGRFMSSHRLRAPDSAAALGTPRTRSSDQTPLGVLVYLDELLFTGINADYHGAVGTVLLHHLLLS
jgi:hypothetical protein